MTRIATWLAALLVIASRLAAQSVKVSVLDRGQADGIVVRTPNHSRRPARTTERITDPCL